MAMNIDVLYAISVFKRSLLSKSYNNLVNVSISVVHRLTVNELVSTSNGGIQC